MKIHWYNKAGVIACGADLSYLTRRINANKQPGRIDVRANSDEAKVTCGNCLRIMGNKTTRH